MQIVVLTVVIKNLFIHTITEVNLIKFHTTMLVKIIILFKKLYQIKLTELIKVMVKDNVKTQTMKEFSVEI